MAHLAIRGGSPIRSQPYPQWPVFDAAEERRLLEVLHSNRWWSSEGARASEFESAWAGRCGVPNCVAVTNGTHAIEVALLGLGIGEGDEVIVPDYTFLASASAVATVNAVPVLVDVDPATFCIDPAAAEAAITPRTRAVIAVHVAGLPCDMDALVDLCKRHNIALIEDCAHAHGSMYRDRPVGGFGAAGTWSFQQSKLLTAGEGGAISVRDAAPAALIRSYADCGRRPGEWFYSHFALGGNFRMTEWQAAVLLGQLERFDSQNACRNRNALALNTALARIPGVHPQARDARTTSQGYYCYVLRIDEAAFGASRDRVLAALKAEGMPLTMSYPPIHQLATFARRDGFAPRHRRTPIDYGALNLPVTTALAAETLWARHALLMGSESDALMLAEALDKIQRNLNELP